MNDLIEKAKSGNSKAFMIIVDNLKEQIYKTAYTQLRNEHDALDAVQETLAKAFSNIKSLKQNQFFKTWLIRILINECHNIQRYRSKVIPMEKELIKEEGTHENNFLEAMEMVNVLNHLEDIYRQVVDLRYNQDMKLDEIAEVLDIPAGTVKSRLNRAHKMIREQYLKKEVSL